MARERSAASATMPVRPVPSIKSRDPTVDEPDYILLSKSRLNDLIDFLSKNKVLFASSSDVPRFGSLLFSPLTSPSFTYFFS